MFLEVRLVGIQHPVKPRQQLLRTVVRMQHHRDSIASRNRANEVSRCYGAGDRGFLLAVREAFACKVGGAALRDLEDDG